MKKFSMFRVWPSTSIEDGAVVAYGRTAQEAADEAFLDFVALDDPPASIELCCRRDHGSTVERVVVEPAFRRPFLPAYEQPELQFA